jgi:hypothetical protein
MKLRLLTGIVSVSMAMAALPAAGQSSSGSGITTVHISGTEATVFGYIPNGTSAATEVNIIAQRATGQQPGSVETFLTFDVVVPGLDGSTDIGGFGTIPNSAMRGDGTARETLDIDLSQVPGFSAKSCSIPSNGDPVVCQPAPLGWVHAEWQRTGNYTLHITGTEQSTYFQFKTSGEQNETLSGSLVSGTILGMTFTDAGGSIGTSSSTEVTLQRIR